MYIKVVQRVTLVCLYIVRLFANVVIFITLHTCVHAKLLQSCQLFAIPWTTALQDPLSVEFPSQEYWSGLPYSPPGDIPKSVMEPMSLIAGEFFTTRVAWEAHLPYHINKIQYHCGYSLH